MRSQVASNLFSGDGAATRLVAGRSRRDGSYRFPLPDGPEASLYETVAIGPEGRLWSYTIQRFCPKAPYDGPSGSEFHPYALGYIEFPELIVEGRIVVADFSTLNIGQTMVLTTEAYRRDEQGEFLTFAFTPYPDAGRS